MSIAFGRVMKTVGVLICVLICGVGVLGCGKVSDSPKEIADMASPTASPIAPRGTIGAHVWFETSARVELTRLELSSTNIPYVYSGGTQCWRFERDALTAEQLAALNAIELIALRNNCIADGAHYDELTIVDEDGTRTTYRDTGCPSFQVDGATAMLPSNALTTLHSSQTTSCPD